MKTFKDICRLNQTALKKYLKCYLTEKKYEVVAEDGFLYAKGDVPVLLVAHLDTVHKNICTEIRELNGRISSPQGIGGDDRCGVYIIMQLVRELHCSVLFCEDEEIGAKGARKFVQTEHIKNLDVNYMIEFDRRGNNDAVFYSCDNKEFTKFVTSNTGFKEVGGSFSDISVLAPAAKIAAVNLSSGYYNAHTTEEYVIAKEMMNTASVAKTLIATESKKYEYVQKQYVWNAPTTTSYMPKNSNTSPFRNNSYAGAQMSMFNDALRELDVQLEVVWEDLEGNEMVDNVTGSTKAEAWAMFFLSNPEVSFNMIYDYCFC